MPYEVIKRVGARAYRYRVESYRDPQTNKVRSRWIYLGRLAADPAGSTGAEPPPIRRRSAATRDRLIDAFETALETVPYQRLTAGTVADRAGLAHGTFYRYFSDKRALLHAGIERVRQEFTRSLPTFEPPYGTEGLERKRVRLWVSTLLASPAANLGLLRAYIDALETDAELREHRAERHKKRAQVLRDYLVALDAAGAASIARPDGLAAALLTLVDATLRSAVACGAAAEETVVEGVCDVFERAIFSGSER